MNTLAKIRKEAKITAKMPPDFKINVLLLLMVTQCISMNTGDLVGIVSQVKKHFHSRFVFLLLYKDDSKYCSVLDDECKSERQHNLLICRRHKFCGEN